MDVNITSTLTTHPVNAPSGGWLAHLLVVGEQRAELISYATTGPSREFSVLSLCALDLLTVSGYSPLDRFVGSSGDPWVLDHMQLSEGALFPVVVMLPVATARGGWIGERNASPRTTHEGACAC
jgi:sulfate adenylyltransferase